jgi:hypothetical protein
MKWAKSPKNDFLAQLRALQKGLKGSNFPSLRKLLIALVVAHYSADHRRRCSFSDERSNFLVFLLFPLLKGSVDGNKNRMARPEGKSSNSLVDTLVRWTEFLEAA